MSFENQIKEILKARLEGTATEEELAILREWLDRSPQNRELAELLEESAENLPLLGRIYGYDEQRVWGNIRKAARRRRMRMLAATARKYAAVAAVAALLAGGGRWGAVPGALLGCVPQCGFSAIASNFYASRVITLGTLMAVYLATSDEAIPLLVSMPAYWDKLILLMVIKVVYAVFVGFLLDFVLRKALPRSLRGGYTGHADEVDCHEEHSDEEGHPQPIWKAALRHTLEIFVFIFVFSLVFGLIVEGVGEDVFASVLGRMGFFQPVVAALVGLVPNCAASVLMTQLYVEGALRFSSLVAGLCTGAGVGLAVLWRVNPSWKQNLFITGLTWACGAAVGVGIQIVVAFIA